ncbi:MAG: hypothetical protein CMC88_08600 [Flavobacteriaceae bacterium]|nr:hypothetical protein [Flavobacteriaceae bacterium]
MQIQQFVIKYLNTCQILPVHQILIILRTWNNLIKLKILLVFLIIIFGCRKSDNPLDLILNSNIPEIKKIKNNFSNHEIQILYSSIQRDSLGKPTFKEFSYNLDKNYYYYPASTVKLPIAILAIQKINYLIDKGFEISINTPFIIIDLEKDLMMFEKYSNNQNEVLSVANCIKKIFLYSDNECYNYLFDFLGRDEINYQLEKKGLNNTRIYHKFLSNSDNVNSSEFLFISNGDTIYKQNSIKSNLNKSNTNLKSVLKGKKFLLKGKLVNSPFDFSFKNQISITDLNNILKRIIFPENFKKEERFDLHQSDYNFLKYWMSRTSIEDNKSSIVNRDKYWDSYSKFFIYGDKKGEMNDNIRISNKVGMAYGTLTDVAYVRDKINNIEFMLTATILVNDNKTFNDDIYEYESKGIPFLSALGRQVLKLERNKLTFD